MSFFAPFTSDASRRRRERERERTAAAASAPPERRKWFGEQDFRALCLCGSGVFFSVLPADVTRMLGLFLWRVRPHIGNPTLLKYFRSVEASVLAGSGMLADASGNFILYSRVLSKTMVYNSRGVLVGEVGGNMLDGTPTACTVDSRGALYVCESGARCVRVFCGSHTYIIGADHIRRPTGLDLSRDDALLYVTSAETDTLCVFDNASGKILRKHNVVEPRGVAALSGGNVAVAGGTNAAPYLCVLRPDGTVAWTLRVEHIPYCLTTLAVDRDDNIYGLYCNVVVVVSAAAGKVLCWIKNPDAAGYWCNGLAICPDGTMAVYVQGRLCMFRAQ